MTAFERDGSEVEALLTDLYLESVLARAGADYGPADARLDPALRAASDRLRRDLVRVHPSFRFEERLATRLAEAAASLRMPAVAGGEDRVVPFLRQPAFGDEGFDPLTADDPGDERRELARPLLIGGALTSAALSLAGAAFVAWRRTRPGRAVSPMVRAARIVRQSRIAAAHQGRLD
ncbi:MAG TPA: hypothetical protein VGQ64_11675 [Candidatus Limnocylindrales bacterium]|jgi:hypothetical protein|nr:hypothetical protein [Candidatus Limnocylindrales bacterium]